MYLRVSACRTHRIYFKINDTSMRKYLFTQISNVYAVFHKDSFTGKNSAKFPVKHMI